MNGKRWTNTGVSIVKKQAAIYVYKRMDYDFKLAKELAEKYTTICIEDLNIKAMQRMWGRKISDLAHSQFIEVLKHQCTKVGTMVVEIPRFYPSSKTCFVRRPSMTQNPTNLFEGVCQWHCHGIG